MKLAHLAAALLAFAAVVRADAPPPTTAPAGRPIEVCFVLDTTGSMGGLIEGAKQKIWSMANDIIATKPKPTSIKIALIGYRDRGDAYVTEVHDLTDDIDTVFKNLQTFSAGGGGDEPESVNQALSESVDKIAWSRDDKTLKIIFLVGDAPPHMDYADDVKYPETCQKAVRQNLIINTVQCGAIASTTPIWQEIAKLSEGSYVQLGQTGDMTVIATPMDADLAKLNRDVGETLVPFGNNGALRPAAVAAQAAKQSASEDAVSSVTADRLRFNMASGKTVQGDDELIDAIREKRVQLKDLKDDQLPESLRNLTPEQREAKLAELTKQREEIRGKIAELSKQRDAFIAEEKKKQAAGKQDSFDEQVSKIIADQAARQK